MQIKKVTSQDVAMLAGVSQSAVSRCFTPGSSVSKKTADKVLSAADILGYRPNSLARSLITGSSRIIGVVMAYLDNQFYPETLEILSNQLRKRGYHLLIFMSKNEEDTDAIMKDIMSYQVDGLILASVSLSSQLADRCHAEGIPLVLFNRHQTENFVPAVTANNYDGGRQVAKLFIQCGFERIGYIAGWEGASTQQEREQGFVDYLHEAGITLFDRQVGNYNYTDTIAAAYKMFDKSSYPEAVFVANDHMAFAVMGVLEKELNLNIPKQVSVMGFDDVPLANWPSFNLTTMHQPAHAMVDETIRLLLEAQTEHSKVPHIQLACHPVIRNTIQLGDNY